MTKPRRTDYYKFTRSETKDCLDLACGDPTYALELAIEKCKISAHLFTLSAQWDAWYVGSVFNRTIVVRRKRFEAGVLVPASEIDIASLINKFRYESRTFQKMLVGYILIHSTGLRRIVSMEVDHQDRVLTVQGCRGNRVVVFCTHAELVSVLDALCNTHKLTLLERQRFQHAARERIMSYGSPSYWTRKVAG